MMKRVDIGAGHERLIGGACLVEHRLTREPMPLGAIAAAGAGIDDQRQGQRSREHR